MVVRRNIYKGVYLQRGSGVGSILSLIFRSLVPWIKRGATALVKSKSVRWLAKSAGKTAAKSAASLAQDVLTGNSSKASAKNNLQNAKRGLQAALSKAMQPPPAKRKKVIIQKPGRAKVVKSLIG